MRIIRLMSVFAALLGLAACATPPTTSPQSVRGTPITHPVWVGVVIADQTPAVDREVVGRANYLMPLYLGIQAGRMKGPNDEVRLFIQNGSTLLWEGKVRLQNGIAKVALPAGTKIQQSAGLCVEVPWPLAHQRLRPKWARDNQNVMCTEDGALARYIFNEQRGRTEGDAYGVVAVRSRG